MSGKFTRRMYDNCAYQQDTRQSTDPLSLIMDINKYVNNNNLCKPSRQPVTQAHSLVDVESSLWGLDKTASDCNEAQYPFCASRGCLVNNDPRISAHITPYACERGHDGEKAVTTTNMRMPAHAGYTLPNSNVCNGYSR